MSRRFEALPQGTSLATYQAAVTVELGFACEQYQVCPLKKPRLPHASLSCLVP